MAYAISSLGIGQVTKPPNLSRSSSMIPNSISAFGRGGAATTTPMLDYAGGAQAAAIANANASAARAQHEAALTNSQNALAAIQAAGAQNAGDIAAARQSAAGIDETLASLRALAEDVRAESGALAPYAQALGGYGNTLWNESQGVLGVGNGLLGMGNDLFNFQDGLSGLGGEYLKLYRALGGDSQVSMAASDVQKSFQNAAEQAERDLARRGVNVGSGASQALRQQFARAMATALAAAKTRARKASIGDQAGMLDKITSAANTMIGLGNQTLQTGNNTAESAIGAQQAAASVQNNIISQLAAAGQLYASEGQLRSSQANTYLGVSSANNQYLSILRSAYGDVTNATTAYGQFLGDIAGGFYSYAMENGAANRVGF